MFCMEVRKSPLTQQAAIQYPAILKETENLDPQLFLVGIENMKRNRWPDVLPNEPTRFKIESEPTFYFNANWVLEKRAIACQGPLSDEIGEFWKMVWHADVQTIVMLTNLVERKKDKCSQYWKPLPFKEETICDLGKQKIVRREIKVSRGNETRTVVQYHLQNWPDMGVVSPETLAKLVELVAKRDGKFLAHCSAGLGRTGTFLAAIEAFRQKTSDIFNIVAHLRNPQTGRVGSIQTDKQYWLALKTAQLLKESSKETSQDSLPYQSSSL